jgi:hypothetical protein
VAHKFINKPSTDIISPISQSIDVKKYSSAPPEDMREQPWKEWYEEEAGKIDVGEPDLMTVTEEVKKSKGDLVAA